MAADRPRHINVDLNGTSIGLSSTGVVTDTRKIVATTLYGYSTGGASLTDFLSAQSDYRTVQQAYLQLVGSYLTAAAQLNLAVGREVIP